MNSNDVLRNVLTLTNIAYDYKLKSKKHANVPPNIRTYLFSEFSAVQAKESMRRQSIESILILTSIVSVQTENRRTGSLGSTVTLHRLPNNYQRPFIFFGSHSSCNFFGEDVFGS